MSDQPRTMEFRGPSGLRLVADAWGEPTGLPVLLLHGGGQTRHAWRGTARSLAANGFYAVALDMRGHGESDWCADAHYQLSHFAEDISAVAAELGEQTALVGASLGGLSILVSEGEMFPGRASAVVLVDVTPRLELDGVEKILGFMRANPEGFVSVDEAADAVAAYLPHRPRPSDTRGLEKNLRLGEDGRYRWHWDPEFLQPRGVARTEDFARRMHDASRSLRVPALLVRGGMSEIVSEESAREFLELVPHAEYVDVQDAAHMVAGDRNDAFSSAVVNFLTRSLGSGPPG